MWLFNYQRNPFRWLPVKSCLVSFLIINCLLNNSVESLPKYKQKKSSPIPSSKCGYESCHPVKDGMLNVHLVPHTHDDVGWLKTVDQYYYGSQSLIQKAGVQYILDSVIQELIKDANKRFIYVESAFFFKWWQEQTEQLKQQVKMLVNEGRLEFIGGAWSMNDEATTHYQSIIDQFSWGLRMLNDTFGECGRPRIGWQIDPFGHSREMASIFAQMGFDAQFFGRLDYQDKDERLVNKKAEMIWRASANLGDKANLFTGALFNQYQPPPGFCFDILCAEEPIIDDPDSADYNVDKRVDQFFQFVEKQSRYYRTNHLVVTMGGDFTYQDANVYFKNLDKLMRYANERQQNGSNINLLYSTPSCYLKSLHDAGITWPTKDDDFFPYASDPHAYWTGYFTSRPTLKRFERVGNHALQVCKQLTAFAPQLSSSMLAHLSFLRDSMGVMQHHDAVTGTEKQKVAFDYAKKLDLALRACGANAKTVLNDLSNGEIPLKYFTPNTQASQQHFEFKTCSLLNISNCDVSEQSSRFILTLYNPLSHATFEYVRFPVTDINYEVKDYRDVSMELQFVPIPEDVQKLKQRDSAAVYELIFLASEIPPMGYKSYYISRTKPDKNRLPPMPAPDQQTGYASIKNEYLELIFDSNGFLSAISTEGMTRIINQEFLYYEAALGNNREFRNRSSGAYIFRPSPEGVHSVAQHPTLTVYRGELVQEVHQQFNEWISQVVRLYSQQKYAEFEWLVGPIPIDDGKGKEIITRFNSDIKSKGVFYTDSNGREMLTRQRDHRDTWKVRLAEHTAGNYYPVTSKIALEDDKARLAILNDRAQGGSSMGDGSLELMLHRRLLHDDAFGVEECLNETAYGEGLVARGIHYLILGSSQKQNSPTTHTTERFTQLEKLLPTQKFFSAVENYSYDDWRINFVNIFSAISLSLPKNIHLMTFEPWHENEILIRFEHILEKDEDPEYSQTVQFNIKDILRGFNIEDIRETTLDGNAWLAEHQRLEFVPDSAESEFESYAHIGRSVKTLQLLDSAKPLLATKYVNEILVDATMSAESNRIQREISLEKQLNRQRAEKLKNIKLDVLKTPTGAYDNDEDDLKFIIELSAMEIRTFVLYLSAV